MKFIKSDKISEYYQLLDLYGEEYNDALFLDTSVNRLYIQGEPVDARVSVTETYGDDNLPRHSYVFTDGENKSYVLKESLFGTLDENNVAHLHDSETGEVFPNNDGLMTVSEKFALEGLCRICGVTIDYTYWASVNHVKDRDNNRLDVMTDVDLYIEDGKFYYDYDEYEVVITLPSGQTRTETFPAGKEEVPEELVRVATMKINRKAQNEQQYHANRLAPDGTVIELEDNAKTAVKHGGIPAGTSVEDLEKMTTNQVITEVLFQKAVPVMVNDTSAYIYFDESYTNGKAYVEVGSKYPRPEQLCTEFIPATYQLYITEGDTSVKIGAPQILTEYVESKYTLIDYQHPWQGGHGPVPEPIYDIPSEGYSEHLGEYSVEPGDKSIYVAEIYYRGIANAVDSDGNETYIENGEVKYYGKYKQEPGEEPLHISSANAIGYTGENYTPTPIDLQKYTLQFSIIAAWKAFSNASMTSSKPSVLWEERHSDFGPFKGNTVKEATDTLMTDEDSVLYLAWPSYTTPEDHFYVYIPVTHEIESVSYAHDFVIDNYNVPGRFEYVGEETISIETEDVEHPIEGVFSCYEIEKAAVNTVAKVKIVKSE